MSAQESELEVPGSRASRGQIVGGFLSSFAIFAGLAALVYYPGRIGPGAILVALVGAGMGSTIPGLGKSGMIFASCGWLFGMIIAVALERPIF